MVISRAEAMNENRHRYGNTVLAHKQLAICIDGTVRPGHWWPLLPTVGHWHQCEIEYKQIVL